MAASSYVTRQGPVTILSGATVSSALDIGGFGNLGVVMPAAFTGATISFQVSSDGTTYQALYDASNTLISRSVTQGRSYPLPPALSAWRFIKIVSASAEAADRTVVIEAKSSSVAGDVSSSTGGAQVVTVGTGATDLGKAEDAAHASGDVGTMALGVRNDNVGTTFTNTNGDYSPVAVDSRGRLYIATDNGASSIGKTEDLAHTSGDTGVMALAVRNDALVSLTSTDLDYSPLSVDSTGRQHVNTEFADAITLANGMVIASAPAALAILAARSGGNYYPVDTIDAGSGDGQGGSITLQASAFTRTYNGTTWDNFRNNMNVTLITSAARTATNSSADQTNYNGRGVVVFVNVTVAGTGSITVTIERKDPISGTYSTILASAAITTISHNIYQVMPSMVVAANSKADEILPRTWRVTVTHNNANSITYSVGASVVV